MATERDEARSPTVSKTEARQGVTGHNVRYVLAYGLGAAIVVLALVYLFFLR